MKFAFSLVVMVWAAVSAAQHRYEIRQGKNVVGQASLTQKLRDDGGKNVLMTMELQSARQTTRIRLESQYDRTGATVRKFMETAVDGRIRKTTVVTFDANGANVVIDEGGKRTTKEVALVANAKRNNPAEFWFLRDKPKPKDRTVCYVFDMDTLSWQLITTVYRGLNKIEGKQGHEVGTERYVTLLDPEGTPLVIDLGGARLVRK